MGCICSKAPAIEDSRESPREGQSYKGSSELRASRVNSSRREGSFRVRDRRDAGEVRVGFVDKKFNGSKKVRDDHFERKAQNSEIVLPNFEAIGIIPKATEGEQVAAGWPSWLAAVAGEAISGWVPRRAETFEKLDKIGQGTYSSVYKAQDLIHKKVVALKRVRFDNMDPESVKFMAREILILRRLDHPNIIKLEGLVSSRTSCSLYLVFEYMEHDLTGLASLPGVKFSEPQYFTTKPLPCDPSCLPKYPPSKEIDAKLRDEEARRKGAAAVRGQRVDQGTGGTRLPRAVAPNANAELIASIQRRQGTVNSKSRSELFNYNQDEAASGFPMDPPRQTNSVKGVGKDVMDYLQKKDVMDHNSRRASHSGPLGPGAGWTKTGKKYEDISIISSRADLSTLSGLVASRTMASEECGDKQGPWQSESTNQAGRASETFDLSGSMRKNDWKHHHSITGSRQTDKGRSSTKEPLMHGHHHGPHGTRGNKIHFSGPLLVPSNNMDQMLKEHDRQIQENVRRARLEKARLGRLHPQGMQMTVNPMIHVVSSNGAG